MTFAQDAADKTGKSRSSVERSVRIGERLTPEAEDEAKKLGLDDHQAALLDAAKAETAGAQIEVLNRRAATFDVGDHPVLVFCRWSPIYRSLGIVGAVLQANAFS